LCQDWHLSELNEETPELQPLTAVAHSPTPAAEPVATGLLPEPTARQLIDPAGQLSDGPGALPPPGVLRELHRRMVIGRRFDAQATALTKQGRLAVYPSSHGQDACQVGAVLALRERDWLFPTYRDSVAIMSRGVDPVEVLCLLRGEWHCGYDPYQYRVAPQCTPLATNTLHAVGLAHAARLRGEDTVALVLVGDGATSEGDTHEALNFAAVWKAPVVFLVQNNGYAISVPLAKQTAAPTLAHKGVGYGMPGLLIDGNDAAGVYATVTEAIGRAGRGEGPTLIEALTYRIEAHTNADDATRYRERDEVAAWLARDPLARLETYLRGEGLLDDAGAARLRDEAEAFAASVRERMNADPASDPAEMFAHVYAAPTAQLVEQRGDLLAEIRGHGDDEHA
jgi:2-oxoisovalerate dehydrogenase E1 component alpha subunit